MNIHDVFNKPPHNLLFAHFQIGIFFTDLSILLFPDTHYQYDVSVWYDNNDADENFVKQVLLPLLEQSALTFCLHAKSETEDNQEGTYILKPFSVESQL